MNELNDKLCVASYLLGLFTSEDGRKILESESFDDDFNEMVRIFETTEPIALKKQFIEIVESCRDKTKRLNAMHIRMKNDAEYKAKVIASIGIAEGEQDDSH